MKTLFRTARIVFATHAIRTLLSRRMLVVAILAAAPAVPALLLATARRSIDPVRALTHTLWFLSFQAILPLVALIGASAVIAEEVSDRTLAYSFTRPISRPGFFLGRWLACVTVLLPIALFGVALTVLAAHAGPRSGALPSGLAAAPLAAAALGIAAYSGIFAAVSALVAHPMIAGLAYAFAFEALLANLPGTTAGLSIQYHVRSFLVASDPQLWTDVATGARIEATTAAEAARPLLLALAVGLALGCIIVRRRQYRTTS